jgi:hypothetical protein
VVGLHLLANRTKAKPELKASGPQTRSSSGMGLPVASVIRTVSRAISTKFVQGFPGLVPRRAYDKDAGAIARVFRFHNNIHDFHHAQLREANPLIDVWLHRSCADPERSR